MAVAARAETAAVTRAEVRQQDVVPRSVRKHRKRRKAIFIRGVACIVGIVSLLGYIGLYAQITRLGYMRSDLAKQTRQVTMENEALKADIQILSSPDRLSAAADAAGMEPGSSMLYIAVPGGVRVALAE